ncbi:MAG: RyR domain-containing protein [Clostridiales bacterium]|nr:RyR domain-containing protein [Clostridiales bacterium]
MRAKNEYYISPMYCPLETLTSGNGIPLFVIEHLRQLDFLISREVSYERTVDDFLLQLAVNDALRELRARQDMVVLLNEEGALVCEDGFWSLYFTPNYSEKRTLTPDSDLYQVYVNLEEKYVRGEVCKVTVPERSLKALVAGSAPFCILDEFCGAQDGGYLAVAQEIVLEGPERLYHNVPVCRYGALSTVDLDEIEKYHAIKTLMDEYIYSYDHPLEEGKAPKPISIAVFGPPGSGKSFGVKQIAKSRGRFRVSSLNLSQYHSAGELFTALHAALEYEGNNIPLIFFDEFDSELDGVSRGWLKYFLAPMQDGEYTLGSRTLSIPGAVFVFAGGTASSFQKFLPGDEEERIQFQRVKGPDFVSRLKGILNIKGPNPVSLTDRRHIIRRALLLRSLFERQARNFYHPDTGRVDISLSLLRALLRVSEFRHGSRSMEFILDMSRMAGASRYTPSCLPLAEQLDIHLDVQNFMNKLSFEQMMGDMVDQYSRIAHERYRTHRIQDALRFGFPQDEIRRIQSEDRMADWDNLKELYKENRRSQIRFLGERFEGFNTEIGLRPILPGAADTLSELYGPILEELAQLEHQRWKQDQLSNGWSLGTLDPQLRRHPARVPYEDLDESVKDYIRVSVRSIPGYLKEIGYELYRKNY